MVTERAGTSGNRKLNAFNSGIWPPVESYGAGPCRRNGRGHIDRRGLEIKRKFENLAPTRVCTDRPVTGLIFQESESAPRRLGGREGACGRAVGSGLLTAEYDTGLTPTVWVDAGQPTHQVHYQKYSQHANFAAEAAVNENQHQDILFQTSLCDGAEERPRRDERLMTFMISRDLIPFREHSTSGSSTGTSTAPECPSTCGEVAQRIFIASITF